MTRVIHRQLDRAELAVARWLGRHSIAFLRVGIGIVYLLFGALKFLPGASPAEDLASRTMDALTLGMIPDLLHMPLLAALECAIGFGFITGRHLRLTLALMAFQMAGALSPLVLFPSDVFNDYAPTLEGQYIIKNLVLIGGAPVIAATLRGGRLDADPRPAYRFDQHPRVDRRISQAA